jgi:hypothetical protein
MEEHLRAYRYAQALEILEILKPPCCATTERLDVSEAMIHIALGSILLRQIAHEPIFLQGLSAGL